MNYDYDPETGYRLDDDDVCPVCHDQVCTCPPNVRSTDPQGSWKDSANARTASIAASAGVKASRQRQRKGATAGRDRHWTWAEAIAAQEEREARRVLLISSDEARRMRWRNVWAACVSL